MSSMYIHIRTRLLDRLQNIVHKAKKNVLKWRILEGTCRTDIQP
uniref:Uncharacterized protein n=1 Tax=Arundo donax TaxID=35708 RepID=A0A0A8XV85_ARUDO